MIRSMTGYGRGEAIFDCFTFLVELKSVNHRFQETIVRLPRELAFLEEEIKKSIQEYVKRGRVDCTLTMETKGASGARVQLDWDLVKGYYQAALEIQNELNLAGELTISDILRFPDVITKPQIERNEDLEREVLNAVRKACLELAEMRLREGDNIARELRRRIARIQEMLDQIRDYAPKVVEQYRDRLMSRVREFLEGRTELDEGRVLNEVAIYADKSDIEEEIHRLDSHCKQFLLFLEQDDPVGRKLDFLIQEMNREINTIGSKANHLEIQKLVVELKSEIEKMREQVQNIE